MMANTRRNHIGLRTVPVILETGNRQLTVNALLDDASTRSYVNADIAVELGIKGNTEKVNVNLLNGKMESFETVPVDLQLRV